MPTANQRIAGFAALAVLLAIFCGAFWWADISRPLVNNPVYQASNPETSGKQHREEPKKSWWERFSDDPIAVFTAVLTVFTGILAWTTWKLVRSAEDTAERQLRAYVHIKLEPTSRVHPDIRYHPKTTVFIRNSGATPAYDVLIQSNIVCRPYIDPGRLPAFRSPGEKGGKDEGSKAPVHPGQEMDMEIIAYEALSEIEYDNMATKGWRLFMYGKIIYLDVFKRERTTEFRLFTTAAGIGMNSWSYCLDGNDAT